MTSILKRVGCSPLVKLLFTYEDRIAEFASETSILNKRVTMTEP